MLTVRLSTDLPNIKSVSGCTLCSLSHAYEVAQHMFLLVTFFHYSVTNKSHYFIVNNSLKSRASNLLEVF